MKKILPLFLSLLLIFTLSSCVIDADDILGAFDEGGSSDGEEYDIVLLPDEDEEEVSEQDVAEQEGVEQEPVEQEDEDIQTEDTAEPQEQIEENESEDEPLPDEDGSYTSKDDVALYIHTYGHLPPNFITKKAAEKLGWPGGSLEPYAPGKCIGGLRFGNYEGILPEKDGRTYTECDIDTLGAKSRGAKRIVFSNDGLIYYTDDHYESFTLLYGSEILEGE